MTQCVHTVALNGLTIFMLDPSQQVRTLYAWKGGGRKEHASMSEAARLLTMIHGGSSTRQTLKPSRLMHAYAQEPGLLNLRIGRVSLSGGL